MSGTALYLYCILPADKVPGALASPTLDGGTVEAIGYQDLAVLAHRCPPEPYQGGEEQVRGWIAAHNAVVEEAWRAAGTVLPMSFDAIVKADEDGTADASLAGWLEEHHERLARRLRDLEGRAEVAVVVLAGPDWPAPPGPAVSAAAAASAAGTAGPAGRADTAALADTAAPAGAAVPEQRARGRAFFAAQQQRREAEAELARRTAERARRYREDLTALAAEVRENEPRPAGGRRTVLSLSLLVSRGGIAAAGDYLDELSREPGLEVRFTGPWPPYSFAATQLEPGTPALALSSQSISSSPRRRMTRASAANRSAWAILILDRSMSSWSGFLISLRIASMAASRQIPARSAPMRPSVPATSASRSTSLASG